MVKKETAKFFKKVHSTYFVVELRDYGQVKVVVDLRDLSKVLVLHFSTCKAFFACLSWFREKDLVNDDVVDVNFLLC